MVPMWPKGRGSKENGVPKSRQQVISGFKVLYLDHHLVDGVPVYIDWCQKWDLCSSDMFHLSV